MVKYRNILVVINPEEERQIALERAVKVAELDEGAQLTLLLTIYDSLTKMTAMLSADGGKRCAMVSSPSVGSGSTRSSTLSGQRAGMRSESALAQPSLRVRHSGSAGTASRSGRQGDSQPPFLQTFIFTPPTGTCCANAPVRFCW